MYPKLHIRASLERRFRNVQHPWVFSGALEESDGERAMYHGQIVRLFFQDRFFGVGVYNHASQIAVRIFSWDDVCIDTAFFEQRIAMAQNMRHCTIASSQTTGYRLIFAEGDLLPGFVVDYYDGHVVMEIHARAAEVCKTNFIEALVNIVHPKSIYEKSEGPARVKDGLPKQYYAVHYGEVPKDHFPIYERGLQFFISVNGQKTGHFADQRDNRRYVEEHVHHLSRMQQNISVLNLCSYTGGFTLAAARGGAQRITSVDRDEQALEQLEHNLSMMKDWKGTHTSVSKEIFSYVEQDMVGAWDMVILDPPAFVKQAKQKEQGMKGYLTLNQKVMERMMQDSFLFTFSCSGMVSEEEFVRMLNWASHGAGKHIQIVQVTGHGIDHPLLPNFPEGKYLKGVLLRIL